MTRNDAIWTPLKHPKVPEGKYLINEHGQVMNAYSGHILTNCRAAHGYTQVCLTIENSKTLSIKTHRLVAETFLPNPNGYGYINHKDENKANNHVSNLEWCDMYHNNHYSKSEYYKNLIGRGIGDKARYTAEDIADIKMFRAAGFKLKDIARVYNSHKSTICSITRDKYRSAACNNQ